MEIPAPQFAFGDIVKPESDQAIRPGSSVGRLEGRRWVMDPVSGPAHWRCTVRWPGGGTSNQPEWSLRPADPLMCDLKVVVSGAPFKIETSTTATVEEVVEQAILKAGTKMHPSIEWELRTEDGRKLTHLVGDAGLVDGETTLFLDPEVGGGGDGEEGVAGYIYTDPTSGTEGGWQGTPPAEGTRRKLIRDTIEQTFAGKVFPTDFDGYNELYLDLADAIEEILQRVDIGADPEGKTSPASTAMDVLDRMGVPRTSDGAIFDIGQRVTQLADELVETRRRVTVRQETIDRLAEVVDAQNRVIAKTPAEGKVSRDTAELRIVLEKIEEEGLPPEYRFVEVENQDGASVGFPMVDSSTGSLKEIVIPYGRDDAWVSEVAYQVAGAATRPLLEDHPDYVFPAERVSDAVAELLTDFGIPRSCRDYAEEQLSHGAKEVDGRRDDTIKALTERCDRLLEQREQSRGGEDTFKAQRDAALHLLRWLIGDLIPSGLVEFAGGDDAP